MPGYIRRLEPNTPVMVVYGQIDGLPAKIECVLDGVCEDCGSAAYLVCTEGGNRFPACCSMLRLVH